jgi:hypothetical protein
VEQAARARALPESEARAAMAASPVAALAVAAEDQPAALAGGAAQAVADKSLLLRRFDSFRLTFTLRLAR